MIIIIIINLWLSQWQPQFGGVCTETLYTCSYELPSLESDNWVFSQFICLKDAKELVFNVTYRFDQCRINPRCDNDYVTMYRYDVDNTASLANQRNPDNYVLLNGTEEDSRLQQSSDTNVRSITQTRLLSRPTSNGFYLGLRDQGTCGEVTRLLIYYTVCEASKDGLVMYPEFANPPRGGPNEVFYAKCVCNAYNTTSLAVNGFSNGSCIAVAPQGIQCECDGGYISVIKEIDESCERKLFQ